MFRADPRTSHWHGDEHTLLVVCYVLFNRALNVDYVCCFVFLCFGAPPLMPYQSHRVPIMFARKENSVLLKDFMDYLKDGEV